MRSSRSTKKGSLWDTSWAGYPGLALLKVLVPTAALCFDPHRTTQPGGISKSCRMTLTEQVVAHGAFFLPQNPNSAGQSLLEGQLSAGRQKVTAAQQLPVPP